MNEELKQTQTDTVTHKTTQSVETNPTLRRRPPVETKRRTWFPYRVLEVAILIFVIVIVVLVARMDGSPMDRLRVATGYGLLVFLFSLGIVFLLELMEDQIDLSELLEESDGGASTSRFQLVVFMFTIAFSLFFLIVNHPDKFPDIPNSVLLLLGISASTYGVSKGLQIASDKTGVDHADDTDKSGE